MLIGTVVKHQLLTQMGNGYSEQDVWLCLYRIIHPDWSVAFCKSNTLYTSCIAVLCIVVSYITMWSSHIMKHQTQIKNSQNCWHRCIYLSCSFGDHYEWNKVTSCIHNILSGQRWVEHYGEISIKNSNSEKCQCKVTFIKVSCHCIINTSSSMWLFIITDR